MDNQKPQIYMIELCSLDLQILDFKDHYLLESPHRDPIPHDTQCSQLLHSNTRAVISVQTNIGKREQNLDKVSYHFGNDFDLIAVFDGHGHAFVPNYLQKSLLQTIRAHPLLLQDFETAVNETFQSVQDQLFQKYGSSPFNSGSTAIIVLITKVEVWIANLGDSRIVSINRNNELAQLNTEHTLLNEAERNEIVSRGGFLVKRGKQYRLGGEINLSRAFGDFKHKPFISAAPEMKRILKDNLKYLLIGSDGFWNEIQDDQVIEKVKERPANLAATLMKSLPSKPSDNATIVSYQFH